MPILQALKAEANGLRVTEQRSSSSTFVVCVGSAFIRFLLVTSLQVSLEKPLLCHSQATWYPGQPGHSSPWQCDWLRARPTDSAKGSVEKVPAPQALFPWNY